MIETVKGIPEFNKKGELLHKCYELNLMEIKKYFVDNFIEFDFRQDRFTCFLEFLRFFLENFHFVEKGFIFGGFVKQKPYPRDVDILLVMDDIPSRNFPTNMYLYTLEQNVADIKIKYLDMDFEESLTSDFFILDVIFIICIVGIKKMMKNYMKIIWKRKIFGALLFLKIMK